MASNRAIAIRQQAAIAKMQQAAQAICKGLGIDSPDLNPRAKKPEIQQAMQLEAVADLLVVISESTRPKPKPKTTKKA